MKLTTITCARCKRVHHELGNIEHLSEISTWKRIDAIRWACSPRCEHVLRPRERMGSRNARREMTTLCTLATRTRRSA